MCLLSYLFKLVSHLRLIFFSPTQIQRPSFYMHQVNRKSNLFTHLWLPSSCNGSTSLHWVLPSAPASPETHIMSSCHIVIWFYNESCDMFHSSIVTECKPAISFLIPTQGSTQRKHSYQNMHTFQIMSNHYSLWCYYLMLLGYACSWLAHRWGSYFLTVIYYWLHITLHQK